MSFDKHTAHPISEPLPPSISSVPVIEEWTGDSDGTLRFDRRVCYIGAVHVGANMAREIANARNATVCSLTEKIKELEEKEASEHSIHVRQDALRELLTRWMKRGAGYLLIRCFSVADAINECMGDLEDILSEHSNASGALPVPENSSSPVPLQEAQSRPVADKRDLEGKDA